MLRCQRVHDMPRDQPSQRFEDQFGHRLGIFLGRKQRQRSRKSAPRKRVQCEPAVEPLGALDALTREKMQSLVLDLCKDTGKTIILITHSVEEALLLGERLLVMAPRPGRIHKEYNLPFAEMGVGADLREVKKHTQYNETREEILNMIVGQLRGIAGVTKTTTNLVLE